MNSALTAISTDCSSTLKMDLYLSFWKKITSVSASSTTFFQNVSQLVSTTASPKHPQSVTGLLMARTSVSGVNTAMNSSAPHAAHFVFTLRKRHKPIMNSASDSTNEKNSAVPSIHPMWNALK